MRFNSPFPSPSFAIRNFLRNVTSGVEAGVNSCVLRGDEENKGSGDDEGMIDGDDGSSLTTAEDTSVSGSRFRSLRRRAPAKNASRRILEVRGEHLGSFAGISSLRLVALRFRESLRVGLEADMSVAVVNR